MKERIKKNLNKIQDLEDKKLLKETMNYVFNGIIDYTDAVYEAIHKRVFDEINLDETRRAIYTTICKKENYDQVDDFMFPMFQEDLKAKFEQTDDIIKKLATDEVIVLGHTYFACDYVTIQEIEKEVKEFQGKLITNKNSYAITIKIQQSKKYINKIENLYYNYMKNNLEWTSLNAPYLYKFFDFIVQEMEPLEQGEEIEQFKISLGEWDEFRVDHVIPLWNLEESTLISANFPIATGDSLRYQHRLHIPDMETIYDNIIRFEDNYNGYVIRDQKSISIIVPEENISCWPTYKFHEPNPQIEYDYEYPVVSNKYKENFLVGYTRGQNKVIRTKAELYRQLDAFELSDLFEIKEIEIVDQYEGQEETYLVNHFIEEDIRPEDGRKIMIISYIAHEETYIARDIMSFIISELQQYFPEYKCLGKML